jgi:hypothetical protein
MLALGAVPYTNFKCSITGVCSGTFAATTALFQQLQSELNRVRVVYGLPADVGVDGKIGSGTLAKLIKTAQAMNARLGELRDSRLDDYVYPDIATNISTKMLAAEADVILDVLRRNGIQGGPIVGGGGLVDPYQGVPGTIRPVSLPINIKPILQQIAVGPTAGGGAAASPGLPFPELPTGAKIVGVSLGGLFVAGGLLAVFLGLRGRKRR